MTKAARRGRRRRRAAARIAIEEAVLPRRKLR
jgi:hypothetical protein